MLTCALQGAGVNHPTKYKQDAAALGRVEGSHHTTHISDHGELDLGVDFTEGGKLENPEKNPRSVGETNNENSTHISSKFENEHGAIPRTRWSPIQL